MKKDVLLLDTDVISFLYKRSAHAERFRETIKGKRLVVSFVTVAELYKWSIRHKWGESKTQNLVESLRTYAVIPYSTSLAWTWAEVACRCQSAGRRMDAMDCWIAACAIRYSLNLVTNNVSDFDAAKRLCGLKMISLPT